VARGLCDGLITRPEESYRLWLEVSATDWSLDQRSHTDCGASLCVIKKPSYAMRL